MPVSLKRLGKWAMGLSMLAAAVPAASSQGAEKPQVTLPAPTGSYGVGVYAQTIADPTRREIFTRDPSDIRRLPVRVFYPIQKGSCRPQPYFPPELAAVYSAEFKLKPGFEREALAHACPDAPITKGKNRFPLIMFSHGLGHSNFSYRAIIEDLVSHGNVVVAVDHTHGGRAAHFPDGPLVKQDNSRWNRGVDADLYRQATLEYPRWWAEDTRRVLDLVTGSARSPVQRGIAGRIDTDRIVYFGHSFGGMAAVYAAMFDMRIKGAVNLDGLIAGRYPLPVTTDAPLLVLNNKDRDETKTYMAGARVLPVKKSNHMTFTDYVWLVDQFGAADSPKGSELSGTESIQLTREVLRLFLNCVFDRQCQRLDSKLDEIRAPLPPVPASSTQSTAPASANR
jgi:predicted dienelactone hydrolase